MFDLENIDMVVSEEDNEEEEASEQPIDRAKANKDKVPEQVEEQYDFIIEEESDQGLDEEEEREYDEGIKFEKALIRQSSASLLTPHRHQSSSNSSMMSKNSGGF